MGLGNIFSAIGNIGSKALGVASMFSPQARALQGGLSAAKGIVGGVGDDATTDGETPQVAGGAPPAQQQAQPSPSTSSLGNIPQQDQSQTNPAEEVANKAQQATQVANLLT